MEQYSHELEAEVLRRTAELARSRQEVIHCLARAAEFRDDDTGRHVFRVGRYARLIGEQMGWQGERLNMLEQAAQLHDIGKIGIPDSILLKPGKLGPEELEIMQKHAGFGKRIMETLPEHESNVLRSHTELGSRLLQETDSPILALAATISLSHHEKFDGSGYPLGMAGEDIPIEGRITAVADVFDALSSKRPYKPPYPLQKCFDILEEGRAKHFDPNVLDAFFRCREQIIRTQMHTPTCTECRPGPTRAGRFVGCDRHGEIRSTNDEGSTKHEARTKKLRAPCCLSFQSLVLRASFVIRASCFWCSDALRRRALRVVLAPRFGLDEFVRPGRDTDARKNGGELAPAHLEIALSRAVPGDRIAVKLLRSGRFPASSSA